MTAPGELWSADVPGANKLILKTLKYLIANAAVLNVYDLMELKLSSQLTWHKHKSGLSDNEQKAT